MCKMRQFLGLLLFWGACVYAADGADLVVSLGTNDSSGLSMRLKIGVFGAGAASDECAKFIKILKQCLEWEQRFEVSTAIIKTVPSKKSEVTYLFDEGFDAALFIEFTAATRPIEWRLYDTKPGEMVCGRRCATSGYVKDAACAIAARIIRELMAQDVPFMTKIAFIERDRARRRSLLCLTGFDGGASEVLLFSRRILVAPSWGKDSKNPLILLSEFTPSNVRFVGIDMAGNKYTVMDEDGTSVGLSYSPVSDDVVYCRSGLIWLYHFDKAINRGEHRVIIREGELCAAPTLLSSGNVIYCSQGKIREWHSTTGQSVTLVGEGYSVAPSYSAVQNKILYSSRASGVMQLFVYDMATGQKTQITFDKGDKVDPTWSPCGNYAAFCWQSRRESRIAIINLIKKEYQFITPKERSCAFPSWSPAFEGLVFG